MKTIIVIDDDPQSRRTTAERIIANGFNVIAAIDENEAFQKLRRLNPQPMNATNTEDAARAKSEFLANMSHELRSPLNAMLLLAEDLSRNSNNLTKDQHESIQVIRQAGQSLLFLINEILEISKLEAGETRVHVREIRLKYLGDYIQSLFGHMADKKDLQFDITIEESLPETIWTDHQKIEQILSNLVSNAVKFTLHGKIEVHFFMSSSAFKNLSTGCPPVEMMAIAVRDTGIGIPKDKQKIIFEAFQQADSGTSRKFGGTGLGLSISKELVELLGGFIHLKSKEGKGSVFTIYLPIDKMRLSVPSLATDGEEPLFPEHDNAVSSPNPPGLSAEPESPLKHPGLWGKKIIVIDPEPRHLFEIAKKLETFKIRVFKAMNEEKVKKFLEIEQDIQAVVISLLSCNMDTIKKIQKYIATNRPEKLPIIRLKQGAKPDADGDPPQAKVIAEVDYTATMVDLVAVLERTAVF